MLGIEVWDWLVVCIYLVGITIIGIWAAKRVKDAASYFIGDRKFGKWMMIFFMFGAGTHSDQAVSVASKTYRIGAAGIWYQWVWLLATPFFWLIAPIFRRMRAVTTGDYFEFRYGPSVGGLYALTGVLQLIVGIGLMLLGSAKIIEAISGGQINHIVAIFAMSVLFVAYGMAGGMSAAIITNFIQGILTIVLSFIILPFALKYVGGMSGLAEKVAPSMMKIVADQRTEEITLFYILIVALNSLIGWVTQPHSMANAAAGKTEMEGRIGVTFGLFTKRICTIAWMLTGLCAIAMYQGLKDPDEAYGLMAHKLLPAVSPGLIGLFIASMLAAVMSTCDSIMVAGSGLFTENLYKKFFVKGRGEKHYVLVGRLASAALVAASIAFALSLESVVKGLETFWKVAAMMGIAFWAGLFWRRATVAGAWAGTLASFAVFIFTSKIAVGANVFWDFNARFAQMLPSFMVYSEKLWLPWQMVMYLGMGLITLVIVSLFTRRVDPQRLEQLYRCLRTPVAKNEPELGPFTLPMDAKTETRKVLVKHPDFEIPKPSLVGIAGFAGSWVLVGVLIWFVYWLLGS